MADQLAYKKFNLILVANTETTCSKCKLNDQTNMQQSGAVFRY